MRKIVGYDRLDTIEELEALNSLYAGCLRLYLNFFQPVMRLIQKTRVGGRLKRKYDTAQTPYQRILKSRSIGKERKQELIALYLTLNPVRLRREIEQHLKLLRKLVQEQKEKRMQPGTVTFLDDWTR